MFISSMNRNVCCKVKLPIQQSLKNKTNVNFNRIIKDIPEMALLFYELNKGLKVVGWGIFF